MILNYLTLLALSSTLSTSVSAFRLPFRRGGASITANPRSVVARSGDGNFNFTSVEGSFYAGIIFANGKPIEGRELLPEQSVSSSYMGFIRFQVALDTGSSDLWFDTSGMDLSGFTPTNATGVVLYADDIAAEGPILQGNITFGNFEVEQQAFISTSNANPTFGLTQGLLGIGPPLLSNITKQLANTTSNGKSFLDNVFLSSPTEPNFMTFSLSRSDMGTTDGGVFTIGEIPEQFSAINDTHPLQVIAQSERWATIVDNVTIGGQQYSANESDSGSGGTNIAVLDTGTSTVVAPPFYVDAMYKSMNGSQFDNDSLTYIVPCDTKVDISFTFGNATFPVNPLDSIILYQTSNGTVQCSGSFMYAAEGFILGNSFLRNVFSLFDFDNWTTAGDSLPFVKLLSVTNATQADAEFESMNNARLAKFGNSSSN